MKRIQTRSLILSLALMGVLLFIAGCNGGSQAGDNAHDSIDTPQVVHVEPQDFPVNDLPDSLFGKKLAVTVEKGLKITPSTLTPSTAQFPEWLSHILDRESIVLFANGILATTPDDVEFLQTKSNSYVAADGATAFVITYSARPSNSSMVVYGAYTDEAHAYWASYASKDQLDMQIKGLKMTENGCELAGEWAQNKPAVPFKASISKSQASLVNGK